MVPSDGVECSVELNNLSVFSSCYLAPIEWYALFLEADKPVIDIHEHFIKQTYRSRAEIIGPQGKQNLIVPVNRQAKTSVCNTPIANNYPWRREHFRSLEAAYRSSPYFEFYELEFKAFFDQQFENLSQLNLKLNELVLKLLKVNKEFSISKAYVESAENDFRGQINPKRESKITIHPAYPQVFQERHDFIPNLSIVDLIFNLGPESLSYLRALLRP